jgi:hypothetical protein
VPKPDQQQEPGASRYRFLYRRSVREGSQRLDALIELLDAKDQGHEHEVWLKTRWRPAVTNMVDSALPAGSKFHFTQLTILFGGLAVPVFASFNAASESPPAPIRYVVLGLSLCVGLATALQQAYRFRENYEVNWQIAGELQAEAWRFLYSADSPYERATESKDRWVIFVRRVEGLLADWNARSISDPSTGTNPAAQIGSLDAPPPAPAPLPVPAPAEAAEPTPIPPPPMPPDPPAKS